MVGGGGHACLPLLLSNSRGTLDQADLKLRDARAPAKKSLNQPIFTRLPERQGIRHDPRCDCLTVASVARCRSRPWYLQRPLPWLASVPYIPGQSSGPRNFSTSVSRELCPYPKATEWEPVFKQAGSCFRYTLRQALH